MLLKAKESRLIGAIPANGAVICLSSMRQLSLAWIQYAQDDSNDRIPYASSRRAQGGGAVVSPQTDPYVWVTGSIDFNPTNPSNWDPGVDLKKSPLTPGASPRNPDIVWLQERATRRMQ